MFDGMGGGGFSDFFQTLFGGSQGGGFRQQGTEYGDFARGSSARQRAVQSQELAVNITLEEAYAGTTRKLADNEGSRFEVTIPQGVKNGSKVRVRDPKGSTLFLKIQIDPHPTFEREGDNLRIKAAVDLYTAVLGGEIEVPTLGKTVALTIPAGSQNGKTFRLKGLGMPSVKDKSQRGDLLVELSVRIPSQLTEEQKALFKQLRDLSHT